MFFFQYFQRTHILSLMPMSNLEVNIPFSLTTQNSRRCSTSIIHRCYKEAVVRYRQEPIEDGTLLHSVNTNFKKKKCKRGERNQNVPIFTFYVLLYLIRTAVRKETASKLLILLLYRCCSLQAKCSLQWRWVCFILFFMCFCLSQFKGKGFQEKHFCHQNVSTHTVLLTLHNAFYVIDLQHVFPLIFSFPLLKEKHEPYLQPDDHLA